MFANYSNNLKNKETNYRQHKTNVNCNLARRVSHRLFSRSKRSGKQPKSNKSNAKGDLNVGRFTKHWHKAGSGESNLNTLLWAITIIIIVIGIVITAFFKTEINGTHIEDQSSGTIAQRLWGQSTPSISAVTNDGVGTVQVTPNVSNAYAWMLAGYNTTGWSPVVTTGPVGMAPWGTMNGWIDPNAKWFWNQSNAQNAVPVGTVDFRTEVNVTEGETFQVQIAGDNEFQLYLDGNEILSGNSWSSVFTATPYLSQGTHVFAVIDANEGNSPNPAGVLMSLTNTSTGQVVFDSPSNTDWITDGYVSNQAY